MSPINTTDYGCDSGQELLSIDNALALLLGESSAITEIEMVLLLEAQNRILAQDLSASVNVPPLDNSAMDGYAIRFADFTDTQTLPISQRIPAGTVGTALKEKSVARIFTGAPIPVGADTVIMQEHVDLDGENITLTKPFQKGQNIRKVGEDIRIGDVILKVGNKLRAQDIGLAASVGISKIAVFKRLSVAIFFTGDELREPGEALETGQIYNSNRYTLNSLLKNLNCDVVDLGIVEDSLQATQAAMLEAAKNADLVMTSGGVSVGEEDYIRITLEALGQLDMWRINIKPGKPLAFGKVGNTPFLGLPGNPVSVFATFCVFARPYILNSQGANNTTASSYFVPTAFDWQKAGARVEYIRVRCENGVLEKFSNQGSGVLTSASWANGLAIIPADTTLKAHDLVEFIPFNSLFN